MRLPSRCAVLLALGLLLCPPAARAQENPVPRRGSYSSYGLYSPRGWLFGLGRTAPKRARRPAMPWERPASPFERSFPVRAAALFLNSVPGGDLGPIRLRLKVILE